MLAALFQAQIVLPANRKGFLRQLELCDESGQAIPPSDQVGSQDHVCWVANRTVLTSEFALLPALKT